MQKGRAGEIEVQKREKKRNKMSLSSVFFLLALVLPNIQGQLGAMTSSPDSSHQIQMTDAPEKIGPGFLIAKQVCVLAISEKLRPGNLTLLIDFEGENKHPIVLQNTLNEIEPLKYKNDVLPIYPDPAFEFHFHVIYKGVKGALFTSTPPSGVCRLYEGGSAY